MIEIDATAKSPKNAAKTTAMLQNQVGKVLLTLASKLRKNREKNRLGRGRNLGARGGKFRPLGARTNFLVLNAYYNNYLWKRNTCELNPPSLKKRLQ